MNQTAGAHPAAKIGFSADDVVMEIGWDDDVEESWRDAIAEIVGSEIEDEDYDGSVDSVLLWFRDGDGDLGDALVDMVGVLDAGGFVVLLTPKASAEEVDASDIDEAAVTSGLHPAGTFTASEHWRAHKLVAPKAPAKR